MAADLPASSTYSGALSYHYPQSGGGGLIRRSLPNMAHSMLVHEPAKIYPYHLLLITNYRLPADVDRCNLEVNSLQRLSKYNFLLFVILFFIKHCLLGQGFLTLKIFENIFRALKVKFSYNFFFFKTTTELLLIYVENILKF